MNEGTVRVGRIHCPECGSDNGKVLSNSKLAHWRCSHCHAYIRKWDSIVKFQPQTEKADLLGARFKKFRGYKAYSHRE